MNYVWCHIQCLWYHTTLWHLHPLYSFHHTQYTCHCILCSCVINYSVLIIKHLLYVWHQTHYMYDITWFYMTSHSLFTKSQYCIHDFTSTLLMTAHPLYMTSDTLYLRHHSHCIYDKVPPIFTTSYSLCRTSQMMYAWRYNNGIWHHTHCVCVISPTLLMISQPVYVWNHTHWM